MTDPTRWQPNLSWITAAIAVGGHVDRERAADLARDLGIGAVVDLRSERCDDAAHLRAHGIDFLHLPTEDHGALSEETISRGLVFASDALACGRKILIHCEHGIGRSATLALCLLVEQGLEPMQALRLAKDKRALISPSPAQYECWAAWLRRFRERQGRTWDVPDFDRFKAVAYRHLVSP